MLDVCGTSLVSPGWVVPGMLVCSLLCVIRLICCCCVAGERHRESVLQNIAVNLDSWTVQTKQETAIYHTLNQLSVDTSRKVRHQHQVDQQQLMHIPWLRLLQLKVLLLCSCCGATM